MKKWIALLLVALFVVGAAAVAQEDGVYFSTRPTPLRDFDDPDAKYQQDVLPTKEDAIAAAEFYFDLLFRAEKGNENQEVSSVWFIEEGEIWTVLFCETGRCRPRGGYEISLRKSDGAVVDCRVGQ